MKNAKLSPLIEAHPGLSKAGWAARQVFIHLVRLSAAHCLGGHFSGPYSEVSWIARRWGLTASDTPGGVPPNAFVTMALNALVAADVLANDEDGGFVIVDWAGCQPGKSATTPAQAPGTESAGVMALGEVRLVPRAPAMGFTQAAPADLGPEARRLRRNAQAALRMAKYRARRKAAMAALAAMDEEEQNEADDMVNSTQRGEGGEL